MNSSFCNVFCSIWVITHVEIRVCLLFGFSAVVDGRVILVDLEFCFFVN